MKLPTLKRSIGFATKKVKIVYLYQSGEAPKKFLP
jgi:hypothetical protein